MTSCEALEYLARDGKISETSGDGKEGENIKIFQRNNHLG